MSGPLGVREFGALVARLGPFGPSPRIAAAVSGGAARMAVLLLAARWAPGAGARLVALTVDHGLRAESAAEAARVAAWCAARGIAHRVLEWRGAKPAAGLQEAARTARYGLLAGWCRRGGIVHLLTGHNAGDQAETFLMRLRRGSGVAGLAGMPAVAVRDGVRVLRPLLGVRRERLEAALEAAGEAWIEDPSNRDPAFERVRVRADAARLEAAGIASRDVLRAVRALGELRARNERGTARIAARAVALFPEGHAEVDGGAFAEAAPAVRRRLLAALLGTVGGRVRGPRGLALDRLADGFADGLPAVGRTLGGCLVEPREGGFRVCREPGAIRDRLAPGAGGVFRWDRRFEVRLRDPPPRAEVAPLGAEGWRTVAGEAAARLPAPVRFGLPALWAGGRVVEIPFGILPRRGGAPAMSARFRPPLPLCGPPFRVA